MMRAVNSSRASAVAALALIPLVLYPSGNVAAADRYRVRTVKITRGLHLSRILDRRGPNRIRVLTVAPPTDLTIDVALSNDVLPGRETTSSVATRRGAIAATNGTYGLPWGRPIGLFAEDGDLKTSPLTWGRAFAISRDEQSSFFGHTDLRMRASVSSTGDRWRIDSWNEGPPGSSEVAALTPSAASYLKPPQRACSVRLYPSGGPYWNGNGTGLIGEYVVHVVRCSEARLWRRGGTLLSTPLHGEQATHIKSLEPKQIVRLSWTLEWPGILDVIAGNPTLLENELITATDCPAPFCNRHPRTGIGVTPEGRLLLVTVDGRRRGYSVGMTPVQFAKLFRHLGATWALNLDGGGSTTMVVEGEVINRPSDAGGEREVSSSVLVLPGPDEAEPAPLPFPAVGTDTVPVTTSLGTFLARNPARDMAVLDPASTGGLLQAMSSGALRGPRTHLSPPLEGIVERFEAARSIGTTRRSLGGAGVGEDG
jgi:hypothetical protein